ncbi:hypothetical protein WMY93_008146 [Mugilogobius chulae]|uniref:Reverse transcriptase domain-containing protein n=1 Tax=Mugilogobius chulae TaxID=88201 RepID=A0AAW0PGA2_9GOBI
MANRRANDPDTEGSLKGYSPIQLSVNNLSLHNMELLSGVIAAKIIAQDCRTRHTNLCTAWIDYKKAYDSMPHTWITECLKLYNINRTLRAFIANSMRLWKTTIEANGKPLAQVSINCGIYQGDALSPLLFCIGLNPLSQIINKTGYGYRLRNGATISHLLYMDNIKLYAKSEQDIDSLIHTTRIYSSDIGMSFGLEKCSRMVTKRGKEPALSTRAIEAQIYHTRQNLKCRLCKEAPETVQHITAGCKMLAGKAYMELHNQLAGIVYRNICVEYGLETPRSKWETPPKVVENDRAKILWDFQIQTDRMVMANQPDIVVVDKEQRRAVVVDVASPSDGNIRRKEHEKLDKY